MSIICLKKINKLKQPLGFEELCDWPLQLWRVAGCVHGTVCVEGEKKKKSQI